MNLRNLFRVSAALFMITGLLWLLAPQTANASWGLNIGPYEAYLVRISGTFNISLAVLAFLASRMTHAPARQAAAITIMVQQALSGLVNLLALLGGAIPSGAGWFGVIFNIVFVLAYGYFGFIRPEPAKVPELQS